MDGKSYMNRLKFVLLTLIILLFVLISGNCTRFTYGNLMKSTTTVFNGRPTLAITAGIGKTPMAYQATLTPRKEIPTKAPVSLEGENKAQCLDILPKLPVGTRLEGFLLMKSLENRKYSYLLNLSTLTREEIVGEKGENLIDFDVTPNGKRVVYLKVTLDSQSGKVMKTNYEIVDTDWKIIGELPDVQGRGRPYWLDNENLLIRLYEEYEYPPAQPKPTKDPFLSSVDYIFPPNHIVYNPSTQRTIKLSSQNFPEIHSDVFIQPPIWRDGGITIYDPTLSFVIYPVQHVDEKKYILYDLQNSKNIKEITTDEETVLWAEPVWSHDGSKFILERNVKGDEEFLIVNNKGKILRTIHFTENKMGRYSYAYNWSPDDSSIAFWYSDGKAEQLGVIDAYTGGVALLCITGEERRAGIYQTRLPVWSPDSKKLVVESWQDNQHSDKNRLILVDLEQSIAVQIGENLIVEGWMGPK